MTPTKEQFEEVINATFESASDPATLKEYIESLKVLDTTNPEGLYQVLRTTCPLITALAQMSNITREAITIFHFGILVGQRLEATNKIESLVGDGG